jgi:Spy/CpxP family protein refolding chaperone
MSSKLKSWLLLAVIFIVGVVTGSALTIGLASHFLHPSFPHDMKKHWLAYLTHELNLTADQQAKIQPILADAETRIRALHRDEVVRGSQIIKAADDQISVVLTPGQKVELQRVESEREKMFSGHMRPWGAPPPGGPDGMHRHDGPDDGMMPPPPLPPDAPTNSAPPGPPPQSP